MPRLPVALALGQQHHHQHHQQHHQHHQQHQQLAHAATLEHLRERLDRAAGGAAVDGPDRKMMRFAEEQQRFMQQALQQNLLAMASHFSPVNLKLNNGHGESLCAHLRRWFQTVSNMLQIIFLCIEITDQCLDVSCYCLEMRCQDVRD